MGRINCFFTKPNGGGKMTEELYRKIGFIPAVYDEKEANAIAKKTAQLFQEGIINEVCVVSDFCILQILKDAGIPSDKITSLHFKGDGDRTKAFLRHLESLPETMVVVHIIATSFCCPRFMAQLTTEESKSVNKIPGILLADKPVFPTCRNLKYLSAFIAESYRTMRYIATNGI